MKITLYIIISDHMVGKVKGEAKNVVSLGQVGNGMTLQTWSSIMIELMRYTVVKLSTTFEKSCVAIVRPHIIISKPLIG